MATLQEKGPGAKPDFLWNDVRDWLREAEKLGELKRIKGANPKLEISAIAQINSGKFGPAVLFEDIKGYESTGFRVLNSSVANIRLFNLTFGGNTADGIQETVEGLRGKPNRWDSESKKYPVEYVTQSPLLENVETGGDVNLMKFPVPLWHDQDGGPFIGTAVAVITRDPDTGVMNAGSYRTQRYGKNLVGINIGPGKHGSYHFAKYVERHEKMPVVVVAGPDPLLYCLAGSEVATGIFELDYLGAMRGERQKVLKGRATGLPIPANAEIAFEGFVDPVKKMPEGPHGEWPGYYATGVKDRPYIEVETLYHRNQAVLLGAVMSKGAMNDHSFWRSTWKSALIYDELVRGGLQNVKGVCYHPSGVGRQFVVISIKQSHQGHATEAGYLTSQTRGNAYGGKWVVVVDEDVNPYDINDVLWAICSRADPANNAVIRDAWGGDLFESGHNNRGVIFATTPYDKLKEYMGRRCFISEETAKVTREKWKKEFGDRWDG